MVELATLVTRFVVDATGLISGTTTAKGAIKGVGDQADSSGRQVKGLGNETDSAGRRMEAYAGVAKAAGVALIAAAGSLELLNRAQQANTVAVNRLQTETGLTTEQIRKMAIAVADTGDGLGEMTRIMEVGAQQGLRSGEALQQYASFWDQVGDATGRSGEELAKQGVALQAVGIDIDHQADALAALGYVQTQTTAGVDGFLSLLQRKAPAIQEMGLSINELAALMGILESRGLTGRAAMGELQTAIDSSDGSLSTMLGTLGISNAMFLDYQSRVEGSAGAIVQLADANNSAYTPMQKFKHQLDELVFSHAEGIATVSSFATIIAGLAPAAQLARLAYAGFQAVMALGTAGTSAHAAATTADAAAMTAQGAAASASTPAIVAHNAAVASGTVTTGAATAATGSFAAGFGTLAIAAGVAAGAMAGTSYAAHEVSTRFKLAGDGVNFFTGAMRMVIDRHGGSIQVMNSMGDALDHIRGSSEDASTAVIATYWDVQHLTDAFVAGRLALNDYDAGLNSTARSLDSVSGSARIAAALLADVTRLNYLQSQVDSAPRNPWDLLYTTGSGYAADDPNAPANQKPKTGGGGGGGMAAAGKSAAEQFAEALQAELYKGRVEAAFGETGAKAILAFGDALTNPSSAAGLPGMVSDLVMQATIEGVPNALALGQALNDAIAEGLRTGSGEGVDAAMAEITAAMKTAGTLTVDSFAAALGKKSADAAMLRAIGQSGKQMMDALDKAIEVGGKKNIESLADVTSAMMAKLSDKAPEGQAAYLGTSVMSALDMAIKTGGEPALASLRRILGDANQVMLGGAIDIRTGTVIAADAIAEMAKAFGVSGDVLVKNIGVIIDSGLMHLMASLDTLPAAARKVIEETLKELAAGKLSVDGALAKLTPATGGSPAAGGSAGSTSKILPMESMAELVRRVTGVDALGVTGATYAGGEMVTPSSMNGVLRDSAGFQLGASDIIARINAGTFVRDFMYGGITASSIPKHADGLDYVPYDNYLAYLHKGERVVPAGGGGQSIVFSPTINAVDGDSVRRIMPTLAREFSTYLRDRGLTGFDL